MKRLFLSLCGLLIAGTALAQETVNPRPLTLAEYQKAKTFTVGSLDNDSYVKFENTWVLDRYEARKPYIITGSDGLKKRIDLYKLLAKEGLQELGTVIFYTSETGKRYTAVMPNFTADTKVWEQYFEDIDKINQVEKNYILKISYVLSKEFGFQVYKNINQGKDVSKQSGTYGTDICFPGDEEVTMADGSHKLLKEVKAGETVMTLDAATTRMLPVTVKALAVHEAKNYAITTLTLLAAHEQATATFNLTELSSKVISATPNHPMRTLAGDKSIGAISPGEQVLCRNERSGNYEPYTVVFRSEQAGGWQKVYSIVADSGQTLILNGVLVKQK